VIASCASSWLYVWSVNGELLASVNTASNGALQINCVSMSQANDWDKDNVIMTGSSDGVVRMYSLDFIQQSSLSRQNSQRSPLQSTDQETKANGQENNANEQESKANEQESEDSLSEMKTSPSTSSVSPGGSIRPIPATR